MRKIFAVLLSVIASPALAQNYAVTQGSGTNFGSKLVTSVNYAQQLMCDPTTPANCVAVDASGRITLAPNQSINNAQINGVTPLMGNGVTGTGSQRVTIASDNTAFTVNAAQSGAWTVNPTTAANWGIGTSTQNSASVANGILQLGQFNTTPTTITSGNMSPLQMDNAGNLLVNVKAGSAGGTSSSYGSAFPSTGTAIGFTDGTNMIAGRIKAASTASIATDPSIVTNESPNSQLSTAIGTTADAAWVSGSGTSIAILKNIASGVAGAIPAGSAIIGKVGIDQTTPGTTNGVQVNAALPAGTNVIGKVTIDQTTPGTTNLVALAANQSVNNTQIGGASIATGSGVMGTGTQRIALATDSPGIVTLGQTTKSASVPMTTPTDQLLASPSAAVLGSYCMSAASGTMAAGLSAASPVFTVRYGGANLALIRSMWVTAGDTSTTFTAGVATFNLFAARSYTVSATGGTASTLTGNNGKLRTSFATTAMSDFRTSSTATLTAGTRTLDSTPISSLTWGVPATAATPLTPPANPFMIKQEAGEQPVQLATNEGLELQATVPATGTWVFSVRVCWDEVSTY